MSSLSWLYSKCLYRLECTPPPLPPVHGLDVVHNVMSPSSRQQAQDRHAHAHAPAHAHAHAHAHTTGGGGGRSSSGSDDDFSDLLSSQSRSKASVSSHPPPKEAVTSAYHASVFAHAPPPTRADGAELGNVDAEWEERTSAAVLEAVHALKASCVLNVCTRRVWCNLIAVRQIGVLFL